MDRTADTLSLQEAETLRGLLDSLPLGVYLVNRDRQIVLWNSAAEKITGYMRHDVVGRLSRENILFQCNNLSCALCGSVCPLSVALHEGRPCDAQVYIRHKAGHRVPVHLYVAPMRDAHGSIVGAAESFEEQSRASDLLSRGDLAAHGCLDVPTGVPNHAFMQSHLRENLAFFAEYNLPFGVMLISVNQLEQFLTTHGREAVDVLLHVVAQTMKHALLPDGVLGRWSQFQFLAIMTNCGPAELSRAARNLEKMVSCSGIHWWDDLLSPTIAVGYTMVIPGDKMESLMERAAKSLEDAIAHNNSGSQAEG